MAVFFDGSTLQLEIWCQTVCPEYAYDGTSNCTFYDAGDDECIERENVLENENCQQNVVIEDADNR